MNIIQVLIAKEHGAPGRQVYQERPTLHARRVRNTWTCQCSCCAQVRCELYGVRQVLSTTEEKVSASPSHGSITNHPGPANAGSIRDTGPGIPEVQP